MSSQDDRIEAILLDLRREVIRLRVELEQMQKIRKRPLDSGWEQDRDVRIKK